MPDPDLLLNKDEREVVRREFMARFNDAPSITEGFHVKRWATGPNKGTPKLTAAVQGLLERGLITIDDVGHWPRAKFTEKGLRALIIMAADRRALDPDRHRLLIDELAQMAAGGIPQ
ncbi:MAG: hypothetical protein WCF85_21045 [Rhodospirillaceae bacterium]